MNLVGKIFTVLIFVMSVVLMSMVMMLYATHTNWRMLVENNDTSAGQLGYKHRLQAAENQKKDLNNLLADLKRNLDREKIEKEQVRAKLETERDELQASLESLTTDLNTEKEKSAKAIASIKGVTDSFEKLQEENVKLRNDIKVVQEDRDNQFDKMVNMTEQLHSKINEYNLLSQRNNDLISESANAMELLRKLGYTNNPAYYLETADNPPATLNAIVLSASSDLVVISCGADDGIRVGHKLEVTRGNTYVGSIEVREVTPDRAICKINKEKQQNSFQVKDRVIPKLK